VTRIPSNNVPVVWWISPSTSTVAMICPSITSDASPFEQESREIARDPKKDLWAHGSGQQCFQLEAEEITRDER